MFLFATILKHVACQFCDNFGICLIIKVVKEKNNSVCPEGKRCVFYGNDKIVGVLRQKTTKLSFG